MTLRRHYSMWVKLGAAVAVLLAIPAVPGCSWSYRLWSIRSRSADPLFQFSQNGNVGYIDAQGRVVLPPALKIPGKFGGEFHEGLLAVKDEIGYRYIDRTGATVLRVDAWSAYDFSEGLAVAALWTGTPKQARYGFIDHTGRFVIEPKYFSVASFSEGLAVVEVHGQYGSTGYLDQFGNFAIPPGLTYATSFHEGLAIAVIDGPCLNATAGSCSGSRFRPLRSNSTADCKFRFIDKTGRPVSDLRFDAASNFSEGMAAIEIGKKWGYVDKSGRIAIEPRFEYAQSFSQGMAAVRVEGKWGFIDSSGDFVIPARFDSVAAFSDGRALVDDRAETKEGAYWFIDKTGAAAFPARFAFAESFTFGLAAVELPRTEKSGRQAAWIDTAGRIVLQFPLE
ncbi:MAG: WG repeat-containing protein [Acidobacteria bacterium]|nr:WG repeat-containing protein [Acidobacteriota bacterium]